MKHHGFLKTFYIVAQFMCLLVSIPKVAVLFAAYDAQSAIPITIFGLPLTDWLIGITIDLMAALTSWAAITKFESSRRWRDLLPPGVIISVCTSISVLANYEDAATMAPARYAHGMLGIVNPTIVNPLIVSCPPLIVFLCILIVPHITAEVVTKSADEIAADAAREVARIRAQGMLQVARAEKNAKVRSTQVRGLKSTFAAASGADDGADSGGDDDDPDRGPGGGVSVGRSADRSGSTPGTLVRLGARRERDAVNALPLRKRVRAAGVVTAADLVEALEISDSYARELLLSVPTVARASAHKNARIEAPTADVLSHFGAHSSYRVKAHGARLREVLNPRSYPRSAAGGSTGESTPLPPMLTFPRAHSDPRESVDGVRA